MIDIIYLINKQLLSNSYIVQMFVIAKNIIRNSNTNIMKLFVNAMPIRYTKPVIPKLVTDNPSK